MVVTCLLLVVVGCWLRVVCSLCVVGCASCVVGCLAFVRWLCVVRCLLFGGCCIVLVVYRALLFVAC